MPNTPSHSHEALAAVRRVREASPSHRSEPELCHAARLRGLLHAILDAADTGMRRPLEEHLAQTIPVLARRGLTTAELRIELAEGERILLELCSADGDRSRRVILALRFAERMLIAGVQARRRTMRHDDDVRLVALLDALPEAIVLADADGRVQLANERARALYTFLDAAGRPVDEIMNAKPLLARLADPDAYLEATRSLLDDNLEPRVDLFRDDDGNSYVRRSIPVGDRGSGGRVLITTSVAALREHRTDLPDAVGPEPPVIELRPGLPRLTLVAG